MTCSKRVRPAVTLATCFVGLAACGQAPAGEDLAMVRDSSGVVIVDNPEDVWAETPVWRVSPEPHLRIGQMEGPQALLFGRIVGVAVLGDGRLVVADGQDRTLRWFDGNGTFLVQRGGAGEGPGEFSSIGGLTVGPGDTVIARDRAGGRLVVYAPDGTHVETISPVELAPASPGTIYRLSDGSWVATRTDPGPDRASPALEPGLVRLGTAVLRVAPDARTVDTLGVFPGPEQEIHFRGGIPSVESPYFGRALTYTAADDRIWVGVQAPFEINVLSPEGEWLRSIRAPNVDTRLGRERVEAFRSWMLGRLDGLPADRRAQLTREFDEVLAERILPDHEPAYSTFLHDARGNLWVAEYRFELNLHPPQRWAVFDPEGRFVTTVDLPSDFTLMAVTDDRMYGRWTDEMDVEHVAAYSVERP